MIPSPSSPPRRLPTRVHHNFVAQVQNNTTPAPRSRLLSLASLGAVPRSNYAARGTSLSVLGAAGALVLITTSCAEPFQKNYYTLDSPRILSITASETSLQEGVPFQASTLVYRDSFIPRDPDLSITWFVPEDVSSLGISTLSSVNPADLRADPAVLYLGEGPDLQLTPDTLWLEALPRAADGSTLLAVGVSGNGVDLRGFMSLGVGEPGGTAPSILALGRAVVPELQLEPERRWEAPLWSAESRRGYSTTSTGPFVAEGMTSRLALVVEDKETDLTDTRWLTVGAVGSLMSLGEGTTDWLAGVLHEEAESGMLVGELLSPGTYTLAAVVGDGHSGTSWLLLDVAVGTPEQNLPSDLSFPLPMKEGERLIWVDAYSQETAEVLINSPGPVPVIGVLTEAASGGLYLGQAEPAISGPEEDPYHVGTLPCPWPLDPGRPFSLNDLAIGRCTLDDLLGRPVVMALTPVGGASP